MLLIVKRGLKYFSNGLFKKRNGYIFIAGNNKKNVAESIYLLQHLKRLIDTTKKSVLQSSKKLSNIMLPEPFILFDALFFRR